MATSVSKWQTANNAGATLSTAEHEILPLRDLPNQMMRTEFKRITLNSTTCPSILYAGLTVNTYLVDGLLDTNQQLLIDDAFVAATNVRILLPQADLCSGQSVRLAYMGQVLTPTGILYIEAVKNGNNSPNPNPDPKFVPILGSIITDDTGSGEVTTIKFVTGANNRIAIADRPVVNSFLEFFSTGSAWIVSGRIQATNVTVTASAV